MVFTAKKVLASYYIYNEDGVDVMHSAESKDIIIQRLKSQFVTDDVTVKWPDDTVKQENKKDKAYIISKIRDLDYQINTLHRHNLSIENNNISEVTCDLHELVDKGIISFSDGAEFDKQLDRLWEKQKQNYYNENHPEESPKENKYFSEETLKEAVGDSGMQQLEAVAINPGEAFLNGQKTNVNFEDKEAEQNAPDEITKREEVTPIQPTQPENNNEETPEDIDQKAKNTLTQGLGKFNTNQLLSITQDGGLSLLSGQITQAAYNVTQLDQVQGLTNIAASGMGMYGMGRELVSNSPEIITTLSTTIISKVTEVVTQEMTEMAAGYLAKHAQYALTFPQQITSYAMAYFNAHKMSIGDILKSLNDSSEGRQEKENEEANEKSKSNFMSKINKNSKAFIDKMNGFAETGTAYIGMVMSYIQNGPEWVINEVDKQIGSLVEGAQKEIDKQWEKDKSAYDAKAKLLGDKLGAEMTTKYNNALMAAQKKSKEKLDKQKKKAMNQLTALKAKAASQLGSLLGIYIPLG